MSQKRLTTNGNVFRRTDGRWQSVIWYFDEQGVKRRKVFSSKTKTEAQQKITTYIAQFNAEVRNSDESQKTIKESLTHWLQVFKYPSVERTTYDRLECTAQHQVYPLIGDKMVGDITAADLKSVLNHWMERGYAYTTVKKVHILLNEYFRYLTEENFIQKNPMQSVPMMKKANFLAAQDKKRYYRILAAAGIEKKGLHSLRHTFASNLVNGIKQEDGSIKSLTPRQVADLLGHSTSQITELYYVKKDISRLSGITNDFNL